MPSIPFVFQDPSGAPLSGGRVEFSLNTDVIVANANIAAKRKVVVVLDGAGSCTVTLSSTPNAVYFINAFTSTGQPAWSGELSV